MMSAVRIPSVSTSKAYSLTPSSQTPRTQNAEACSGFRFMVTGPGVSAPPTGVGASATFLMLQLQLYDGRAGNQTMPPGMPVGVDTPPAGVASPCIACCEKPTLPTCPSNQTRENQDEPSAIPAGVCWPTGVAIPPTGVASHQNH